MAGGAEPGASLRELRAHRASPCRSLDSVGRSQLTPWAATRSLFDACVLEGARFDGFQHVDDWVPQRLVTATGPNPLPR